MIRCPYLSRVTGIHIKNPDSTATAQSNLVATIYHNIRQGSVVKNLGSLMKSDGYGGRTAVKGDKPPTGNRLDESFRGAALRGTTADNCVRG